MAANRNPGGDDVEGKKLGRVKRNPTELASPVTRSLTGGSDETVLRKAEQRLSEQGSRRERLLLGARADEVLGLAYPR